MEEQKYRRMEVRTGGSTEERKNGDCCDRVVGGVGGGVVVMMVVVVVIVVMVALIMAGSLCCGDGVRMYLLVAGKSCVGTHGFFRSACGSWDTAWPFVFVSIRELRREGGTALRCVHRSRTLHSIPFRTLLLGKQSGRFRGLLPSQRPPHRRRIEELPWLPTQPFDCAQPLVLPWKEGPTFLAHREQKLC